MGARVGSLAWCLSVWCRQQRKHASAAASLVVLLCTVSPFQPLPSPADVLQMGHKEREAEFWRIVEDGEDVVEVRLYCFVPLHIAPRACQQGHLHCVLVLHFPSPKCCIPGLPGLAFLPARCCTALTWTAQRWAAASHGHPHWAIGAPSLSASLSFQSHCLCCKCSGYAAGCSQQLNAPIHGSQLKVQAR